MPVPGLPIEAVDQMKKGLDSALDDLWQAIEPTPDERMDLMKATAGWAHASYTGNALEARQWQDTINLIVGKMELRAAVERDKAAGRILIKLLTVAATLI